MVKMVSFMLREYCPLKEKEQRQPALHPQPAPPAGAQQSASPASVLSSLLQATAQAPWSRHPHPGGRGSSGPQVGMDTDIRGSCDHEQS